MDIHRIWAKNPYLMRSIDHRKVGYKPDYSFIPGQITSEIMEFLNVLNDHQVKNMVEISEFQCGTSYLFYNIIQSCGKLISIDIESPKRKMNFQNYTPNIRDVTFKIIVGDSHDQAVLKIVKDTLNGEYLDAIFIDGDHSLDGVKLDFEMYSPLVRSEGIVAFHDIASHKDSLKCFVEKFYRSIKDTHQHLEIIEDLGQGWGGIGILYMGARP